MSDTLHPFNLNHTIKVKLTERGYQRLADLHNGFLGRIKDWDRRDADYYKAQADADGYTSFQAWGFMEKFGPVIGLLSPQYFDYRVLIRINQ